MILSALLRDRVDEQGRRYIGFYCPGCQHAHIVGVDGLQQSGKNWGWNGSVDKPTLTPSIRVSVPEYKKPHEPGTPRVVLRERTLCHSFVTDGRIQFLDDCEGHTLRGWHDIPAWPETYGGMES